MTLLVRDNDDLIAANLDFHLRCGVDHFLVMDNLSTDATPRILDDYGRRGLVTYFHQPEDTYSQHVWVTQLARLAFVEHGADWVINNDADEFWWSEACDLKRVLSDIPETYAAAQVERTNFIPRPLPQGVFFAHALTIRETRSLNPLGFPLPGKMCHRGMAEVEVSMGSHAVSAGGGPLPAINVPITILHFPIRSYEKFEVKVKTGGAALERNTAFGPDEVGTWRHLFGLWKRGELRAYYDAQIPSDEKVAEGLREGRYVIDKRLKTSLLDRQNGAQN